MSYIKELKKFAYQIPDDKGYIMLTQFTDSGSFNNENDYNPEQEKLYYHIAHAKSKEDYLNKQLKMGKDLNSGYVRIGFSTEPHDDKPVDIDEYMTIQNKVFDKTRELSELFERYKITYTVYQKDSLNLFNEAIKRYNMKETEPYRFKPDLLGFKTDISNIEQLLDILKDYEHLHTDDYIVELRVEMIPIYCLVHEYSPDDRIYFISELRLNIIKELLARFDFTYEQIFDGMGLNLEYYSKMLNNFYGAKTLENYEGVNDYEVLHIDIFWNREYHCFEGRSEKIMTNINYERKGFAEYCYWALYDQTERMLNHKGIDKRDRSLLEIQKRKIENYKNK